MVYATPLMTLTIDLGLDLSGAGQSPSGFLDVFLKGNVSLWTCPPPPLEWLSFPPLVAAVLITPKGAESPDSGCIGVIGVLVFFPRAI